MHDSTTDAAVVPLEFWKSAIAGLNTLPGTRTPPDLFPTQLESVKWICSKKATQLLRNRWFQSEALPNSSSASTDTVSLAGGSSGSDERTSIAPRSSSEGLDETDYKT